MKPIKTWIVVADGSRARAVVNTGPNTGLKLAGKEMFSANSSPAREMGTDRPGRVHDRKGPGRHAVAPHSDLHVFEKTRFAKEVAALLNKAVLEKWFDRLVLIAPAKTLGDLRAMISDQVRERVTAELVQDYTHLKLSELEDILKPRMTL